MTSVRFAAQLRYDPTLLRAGDRLTYRHETYQVTHPFDTTGRLRARPVTPGSPAVSLDVDAVGELFDLVPGPGRLDGLRTPPGRMIAFMLRTGDYPGQGWDAHSVALTGHAGLRLGRLPGAAGRTVDLYLATPQRVAPAPLTRASLCDLLEAAGALDGGLNAAGTALRQAVDTIRRIYAIDLTPAWPKVLAGAFGVPVSDAGRTRLLETLAADWVRPLAELAQVLAHLDAQPTPPALAGGPGGGLPAMSGPR